MAIFEKKHFNKPISKGLEAYIIYNQQKGDIKEIAEKYSYTPDTLTAIIRGYRNLNENNASMVIELFKRCIYNYNKNQKLKETINYLIIKAND
tara:strand:- start:335 stop:613 length:279 start_codon:yes stop_codon:yes gene_type:complete